MIFSSDQKGDKMGMDVMGKNPTSEEGEYFRNNVWWWRPLWDYCYSVADDLIDEETWNRGHYNDGAGLDAEKSKVLGERLMDAVLSGAAQKASDEYHKFIANIPTEECIYCSGTGIRTDEVGVKSGMPEKELDETAAIILGRTHGYCNGCSGEGKTQGMGTWYSFSVENVADFARFLVASGGFGIW